jgi:hypothetical protein
MEQTMKIIILHNETRTDGRQAIFTRVGDAPRLRPGDTLYYVGTLAFDDVRSPEAAASLAFEAGNSAYEDQHTLVYRSWGVRSHSAGDVIAVEDDDHTVTALACQPIGWETVHLSDFRLVGAATVSLTITNGYELYDDVTTRRDVLLPSPPNQVVAWRLIAGLDGSEIASGEVPVFGVDDREARTRAVRWVERSPLCDSRLEPVVRLGKIREADPDADWSTWADDHIYPYTGVGNILGDSWYEVEITTSSDHKLIGRTFDWGY